MRVLVPSHAERDTVTVGKASSDCMMDVLAEALHAGKTDLYSECMCMCPSKEKMPTLVRGVTIKFAN